MNDDDGGFGSLVEFGEFAKNWLSAWPEPEPEATAHTPVSPRATPPLLARTSSSFTNDMDPETEMVHRTSKGDRVCKRGLSLDVTPLVGIVQTCVTPAHQAQARLFLQYLIMFAYGRRNLRKEAIDEHKLSQEQREVYRRIRTEMNKPARRARILEFINKKDITRRLINYFVVHYALVKRELSYYLDKRTYPYRILGTLNEPNQPEIVRLQDEGANIVWLNFHQEYKNSKNKHGQSNLHAPYRRSTSVKGADDGLDYSLCELNFYIWLDDVGGFDLFYMFEADIRDQKAEDARVKRRRDEEHQQTAVGKRRKEKVVLRKTDGRNYKTYAVECNRTAAYSATTPTCTFQDYMQSVRNKSPPQQTS